MNLLIYLIYSILFKVMNVFHHIIKIFVKKRNQDMPNTSQSDKL